MRVLEILGFGGDARIFGPQAMPPPHTDEIKGMIRPVEPAVDPRITKVIAATRPKDPEREGLIDTYVNWITDSLVNPAEGNEEVVNVMRAIVSEDAPLPLDKVAAMTGTEAEKVESLVEFLPFVAVDVVNGEKQIDMPEVQSVIGEWKAQAEENLPKGANPEIVGQLLTPPPTVPNDGIEVFTAHPEPIH